EITNIPAVRQAPKPAITAAVSETSNGPQAGDYFNVAPGYSPYLGYTPMPSRSRGYMSGGFPGNGAGATQGNLFAPGNRYTQIITWESVTITFGDNAPVTKQPFAAGNQTLA